MKTIRRVLIRKRLRLKGFDYSKNGSYFVTLCVHDRIRCLGKIMDNRMELSESGIVVNQQIEWLQNQYPYIKIPVYIIMPDHVHAIIEINRKATAANGGSRAAIGQIKIKPLPEVIGAFKTTSSKMIHLAGLKTFAWQRSYHDRIIRNKIQYDRISAYIRSNPSRNGGSGAAPAKGRSRPATAAAATKRIGNGRSRPATATANGGSGAATITI